MNERLFIVDDDPDLVRIAAKLLEDAGYGVSAATRVDEVPRRLEIDPPDLVLMDLRMPGKDGFTLCKELKSNPKTSAVPVVFLSSHSDEADVVAGLELGADDYITKPFRKNELLARVKAVLRRHGPDPKEQQVDCGPFRVDFAGYKAWLDGKPLALTPKEFELLAYFVRREGRVITRAALSEHVWGADLTGVSRTVDTHIERLRRKLGRYGPWIKGLKGVGYRFELEEA